MNFVKNVIMGPCPELVWNKLEWCLPNSILQNNTTQYILFMKYFEYLFSYKVLYHGKRY